MRPHDHVTIEHLTSIIELRSGVMFWRHRGETWFDARHAGRPICLRLSSRGYHKIRIQNRNIAAHRVIWALHHGAWPAQYIDHINRDRTDNRIDNLRDVSLAVNNLNTSRSETGGGVHLNKSDARWVAQIRRHGRCVHLGSFATRDEALRARRGADKVVAMMLAELPAAARKGGGLAQKRSDRLAQDEIAPHRIGGR